MVETFEKQIDRLEKRAEAAENLLDIIKSRTVSEGGKLTNFGEDVVHTFLKHGLSTGDTAKIVGVSTSAISQRKANLEKSN